MLSYGRTYIYAYQLNWIAKLCIITVDLFTYILVDFLASLS